MTADRWALYRGDVMEWAATYEGPKFHAALLDPPYHLGEVPKGGIYADRKRTDEHRASRKGFMGKTWDGGAIAHDPATWAALAAHLHPGAFVMAFASSRGWHRQAVAMEDAGLIMHPSIFGWGFGSGFPKATNISAAIDKAAGVEREVIGSKLGLPGYSLADNGRTNEVYGDYHNPGAECAITAPATPLAAAWQGHRYGLQALKPALEPILVFQKPYSGRPVDSIVATGAGALNIDAARIATDADEPNARAAKTIDGATDPFFTGKMGTGGGWNGNAGRWPSNLLISEDAAERLDQQSGESSSPNKPVTQGGYKSVGGIMNATGGKRNGLGVGYGDTGGASRYFYTVSDAIDAADPLYYCAKSSRREREAGLQGMAERETWATSHKFSSDPRMTHEQNRNQGRNPHPCVKPLDLCRYLATLLLPPAEYAPRRLLCPFAGVGSEMIGALLAGWDHVTGIELDSEDQYIEIADARLHYWTGKRLAKPEPPLDRLPLFAA